MGLNFNTPQALNTDGVSAGCRTSSNFLLESAQFAFPPPMYRSADAATWATFTRTGWTSPFTALASSGSVVMAAGDGVQIIRSTNEGSNWTDLGNQGIGPISNVHWTGTVFVAPSRGNFSNGNQCRTSPDGVTWTTRSMPSSSEWVNMASRPDGVVVCTAYRSTSGGPGRIAYSLDGGISWANASIANHEWTSVAASEDLFIALSMTASKYAISSDGIAWTVHDAPALYPDQVFWTGEEFGIVYDSDEGVGSVELSADGETWTNVALLHPYTKVVARDGSTSVLVGHDGMGDYSVYTATATPSGPPPLPPPFWTLYQGTQEILE